MNLWTTPGSTTPAPQSAPSSQGSDPIVSPGEAP